MGEAAREDKAAAAAAAAPFALPRAVVVGGGPCGSLTAIALAQCGFRVDVYEREEQKKTVFAPAAEAASAADGADATPGDSAPAAATVDATSALATERFTYAIRLTPRGFGAMERFGATLPDSAFDLSGSYFHSAKGPVFRPYTIRAVQVDRNSLSNTLRQQAESHASGRITVHHGMRLTEIDADCSTATFVPTAGNEKAGASAMGAAAVGEAAGVEEAVRVTGFDLLVAADGAKSVCRAQVLKHDPTFTAEVEQAASSYRRIPPVPLHALLKHAPWPTIENAATTIHAVPGKLTRLILTPIASKGIMLGVWIISDADAPKISFEQLKSEGDVDTLLRSEFPQLLDSLVAARPDLCSALLAQPTAVGGWSVWCSRLHWKRMAMVGDAAHAMLATLGQGCNAALEDVPVLMEVLEQHFRADPANAAANIADALPRFTATRLADVRAAVDLSHSPPFFPLARTTYERVRLMAEFLVLGLATKILPGLPKRPMLSDRMYSFSRIKKEVETDSLLAKSVVAAFAIAATAVVLGIRAYRGK